MKTFEEALKKIGENITAQRIKMGFSQEALANQAQISLKLLLRIENGTIDYPIDILFQFADVLNSSVMIFFENV